MSANSALAIKSRQGQWSSNAVSNDNTPWDVRVNLSTMSSDILQGSEVL